MIVVMVSMVTPASAAKPKNHKTPAIGGSAAITAARHERKMRSASTTHNEIETVARSLVSLRSARSMVRWISPRPAKLTVNTAP